MNAPSNARSDRFRLLLWIGAGLTAAAALAGMFGFHDGSVWRLPRLLQGRAEAALSAIGLPGIEVSMDGQTAMLRGVVADRATIATAQQAAATAAGPGGPWAGGVTGVDATGLLVGAIERPFAWSIRREASRVTLSGYTPSEQTKRALRNEVSAVFPNATVVDNTHIAGGAPNAHWRDAALDAVRALGPFQDGEASFSDETIAFTVTGSQSALGSLRQRYQSPQPPFHATITGMAAP